MGFEHAPRPGDELAHPAGPEQLWGESWYLDFAATDGSIGGYVRIGRYPNLDTVWYWACVVGPDRPTVLVVDHEVPLSSGPGVLELRATGLWADHNVETPFQHLSVGLEAFGVAIDDPAEAYRGLRGDRTALGFDLEWETEGEVHHWGPGYDRYEIPCRVHGEILVGHERIELDGIGQRDHSWGVRDWWSQGWCWLAFALDDGTRVQMVAMDGYDFSFGYLQAPGVEPTVIRSTAVETTSGPEGMPTAASVTIEGRAYEVEPLAWAPVLLTHPDGRQDRFPRALVRVAGPGLVAGSSSGVGWIEFNQPQP